ncbi:MAG: Oligosaccharide translocation protein rft1 [Cirrosporium novae-zelandiae]|nr:MAG: Oligosaccharide translocation protein rft1 [Cirrosporium novae-zelandiae]
MAGDNVLQASARGAQYLILLQIGSRALTFIFNQILLRFLSPSILAVSTQLELFSISIFAFSRDSLRVALQRAGGADGNNGSRSSSAITTRKAQVAINISYLSLPLGTFFALLFAYIYYAHASSSTSGILSIPYFATSLLAYGLAALLELATEPAFTLLQQRLIYSVRASAEGLGALTRCLVTCGTAFWGFRQGNDLGVLPFAMGQMAWATTLAAIYLVRTVPIARKENVSLIIQPIHDPSNNKYLFGIFSQPLLTTTINLYIQSLVKYLLTQGDTLLISVLATLETQGAYALASNYGSLIARLIFQPLEETSRSVFANLLASPFSPTSTPQETETKPKTETKTNPKPNNHNPTPTQLSPYLLTLLHLTTLLTLLACSLGPPLAPLLLTTLLSSRWTHTSAPRVLATYTLYIPILFLNGLSESFVAVAASNAQIRAQSAFMTAAFFVYAAAAGLLVGVFDLGGVGLVAANALNLVGRIAWCARFVLGYLGEDAVEVEWRDALPSAGSVSTALVSGLVLRGLGDGGGLGELVKGGFVAGLAGLAM